jgi:hypothetical protein
MGMGNRMREGMSSSYQNSPAFFNDRIYSSVLQYHQEDPKSSEKSATKVVREYFPETWLWNIEILE